MARTTLIMVSDNHEAIEKARTYWEGHDVTFQVYSPTQWRDGLDNAFFRQQLTQGVPALSSGMSPLAEGPNHGNVVQFPTMASQENRVQKMEQLEAKAIEDAIFQFKGNLTEAAKALGIGRATLYRKVKQYHIDPASARKRKQIAA